MKNLFALLLIILSVGCQKDDDINEFIDYSEKNETDIINYIENQNLEATRSNSGLYYIIEDEGDGGDIDQNTTVTVKYKGYYLNGSVFDESTEAGVTFNLQHVISGWTEGITYFKEGGKGVLIIPSHLGYGSSDYNGIPAGSVLIFDIEILNVG